MKKEYTKPSSTVWLANAEALLASFSHQADDTNTTEQQYSKEHTWCSVWDDDDTNSEEEK